MEKLLESFLLMFYLVTQPLSQVWGLIRGHQISVHIDNDREENKTQSQTKMKTLPQKCC